MALSAIDLVLGIGIFVLMTGVGASCEIALIRKLLRSRKARVACGLGAVCQFGIMPLVAYVLTLVFGVQGFPALGFVLAGCMPGGSASNVLTVWCKGILELSVCMTIVSNILAFGMTPLCLYLYGLAIGVESALPFPQIASAFAFLVAPLLSGASLTHFKPQWKSYIEQGLGTLAMVVFALVLLLVCLDNPEVFTHADLSTIVPAFLYFPIASSFSYMLATVCGFAPALRRTITVETGLQNLSLALAIGELSVRNAEERLQLLPFPLFYSMFMYLWMGMLLPLFRWQYRRNEKLGVEGIDVQFFDLDDVGTVVDDDPRKRAPTADELSSDSSASLTNFEIDTEEGGETDAGSLVVVLCTLTLPMEQQSLRASPSSSSSSSSGSVVSSSSSSCCSDSVGALHVNRDCEVTNEIESV